MAGVYAARLRGVNRGRWTAYGRGGYLADVNHALLLDRISKRYAGHLAVHELSLAVPAGSIYGILGPNGAGKSSTLRMAMNIIAPDGGTVRLLGRDPATERAVLRRVGYLPEERGLYRRMRVTDTLVFFARLKGVSARAARLRAAEWLERLGLAEWGGARVDALSKGMQQKVQFIATVLHGPELLFLDEPASGLDPVNQETLRDAILALRDEGRTVVFSTHNLEQAEQLCERVCIIAAGRAVLDGSLAEIRRAAPGTRFRVEWDAPSEAGERLLRAHPAVGALHGVRVGGGARRRGGPPGAARRPRRTGGAARPLGAGAPHPSRDLRGARGQRGGRGAHGGGRRCLKRG
jgi:ABC-2 type transport system ATP-binding protein